MNLKIKGIIIRETDFSENDKYIEVLTYDYGKISVLCKNIRRKNSPLANKTRLFNFGEFEVFSTRNRYSLNDVNLIERFFNISENLDHFALCSYFLQVCDNLCNEDSIDTNITRTLISALYAIKSGTKDIKLVKSALELRLMSLSGFRPIIDKCGICSEKASLNSPVFDTLNGVLCCGNCCDRLEFSKQIPVTKGVIYAMYHIINADIKKLYSFTLDQKSFDILSFLTEDYLLTQTDYNFKTLEFYKSLGGLKWHEKN